MSKGRLTDLESLVFDTEPKPKTAAQLLLEGRMSFGCLGEFGENGNFVSTGQWAWFAGAGEERRALTLKELIETGKAVSFDKNEEDIEFLVSIDAYLKCLLHRQKVGDEKVWDYSNAHLNRARFASEVLLLGLDYKKALEIYDNDKLKFKTVVNELLSQAGVQRKFIELSTEIPKQYRRGPKPIRVDYKSKILSRIDQHVRRLNTKPVGAGAKKKS